MNAGFESSWFLVGLVVGLGFAGLAYLVRRSLWQLLGGALRILVWPFRIVLRLMGIGKRAAPNRPSEMGPAAWAAAVSGHKTLLDAELTQDFSHEEEFISRQGLVFKWMAVRVGFMRMPEEMTDALAEDYARQANSFLGGQVPIGSDPRALFEDVEGAVIARQFAESEAGLIYLLNETRKLMNANVRNVVFQITRNSSYYLIFVPAAFLIALIAGLAAASGLGLFSPFETVLALGWVFPVLFVLVAALYAFFLSHSMRALEEIDQGEWISFHTLRLNAVLGEVVGKYAEDVGYWKNRVGGGL